MPSLIRSCRTGAAQLQDAIKALVAHGVEVLRHAGADRAAPKEQTDKAIDAVIEAVRHDPDTSELHFALGNLFRQRGEFERAVRVHQHLLQRADLALADRERAQHALAQVRTSANVTGDFLRSGTLTVLRH